MYVYTCIRSKIHPSRVYTPSSVSTSVRTELYNKQPPSTGHSAQDAEGTSPDTLLLPAGPRSLGTSVPRARAETQAASQHGPGGLPGLADVEATRPRACLASEM